MVCRPTNHTAMAKHHILSLSLSVFAVGAFAQPSAAKEWQVFLLAGQSNMEGLGNAAEVSSNLLSQSSVRLYHSSSVHSSLPAYRWNPLTPAGLTATHFGPELVFAYRVREMLPKANIALIKHAKGGTKLTRETLAYDVTSWCPGTNASDTASFGIEFIAFVQTVTHALAALRAQGDRPTLSGMVWVQGEADATCALTGEAYETNLTRFIQRVREQFNTPDLPFVCAQVLPYQTRPGSAAVRGAQARLDQNSGSHAAIPGVFTVQTEGLGVHRDSVHFNTPGQLELGARLADAMIQKGLGLPLAVPPHPLSYWLFDKKP